MHHRSLSSSSSSSEADSDSGYMRADLPLSEDSEERQDRGGVLHASSRSDAQGRWQVVLRDGVHLEGSRADMLEVVACCCCRAWLAKASLGPN